MENKEMACPHCKSKKIIKRGFIQTEIRGKRQRFYCKSYHIKFIPRDAFFRMRNSPQKITCGLDLFFRGLSTRDVQSHFGAFFPHNCDHSTILRWIRKFSLKMANFTDNLKINSGSYAEVDEMEYHRRKSHKQKRGVDVNWFIDAIDVKTRFMVSSKYAKHRSKAELKRVLLKLKEKANNLGIVTTDGLTAYENLVKKTWGYNRHTRKHHILHKVVTQSKGEGFNIWVERMHNTLRQRTKTFRGFHGSIESAYAIMKGIEIYYNFIRKHEALKGKTPSELAIPELKLETPNRWLELLNLSVT